MGFIYFFFYKRHFLVIRCRKETSKGLLEAFAFEDGRERPSAPWPFWARSSGLILSCFILFLALTIARLCQEDFQDVGFASERVVFRVESTSGRAWHAGVARARLCIVRIALGQGPTMTRSGGGSGIVTWSVCDARWLGSTVVRR